MSVHSSIFPRRGGGPRGEEKLCLEPGFASCALSQGVLVTTQGKHRPGVTPLRQRRERPWKPVLENNDHYPNRRTEWAELWSRASYIGLINVFI